MPLAKIIKIIKNNKKFILTSHKNLEGDALGSELGLMFLLRKLNKEVVIYNQDAVPFNYKFLPGISRIKNAVLSPRKFDVGIFLDCASLERAGRPAEFVRNSGVVVNIDHHASNTNFGDINWVLGKASSTAELVYRLYKKFFKKVDYGPALCLYTGMSTDTGFFSYSNSSASTYAAAAELVECGVSPDYVYHKVYDSFSIKDITALAAVISKTEAYFGEKVVVVPFGPRKKVKSGDAGDFIFSVLRNSSRAEVFILMRRIGRNKVKVNFRSRGGFNVNTLAAAFGGGGHKNSAGAVVSGSILSVKKKVLSLIKAGHFYG